MTKAKQSGRSKTASRKPAPANVVSFAAEHDGGAEIWIPARHELDYATAFRERIGHEPPSDELIEAKHLTLDAIKALRWANAGNDLGFVLQIGKGAPGYWEQAEQALARLGPLAKRLSELIEGGVREAILNAVPNLDPARPLAHVAASRGLDRLVHALRRHVCVRRDALVTKQYDPPSPEDLGSAIIEATRPFAHLLGAYPDHAGEDWEDAIHAEHAAALRARSLNQAAPAPIQDSDALPQLVTIEDAAKEKEVTVQAIHRHIGKMFTRIEYGGRLHIKREELDIYHPKPRRKKTTGHIGFDF